MSIFLYSLWIVWLVLKHADFKYLYQIYTFNGHLCSKFMKYFIFHKMNWNSAHITILNLLGAAFPLGRACCEALDVSSAVRVSLGPGSKVSAGMSTSYTINKQYTLKKKWNIKKRIVELCWYINQNNSNYDKRGVILLLIILEWYLPIKGSTIDSCDCCSVESTGFSAHAEIMKQINIKVKKNPTFKTVRDWNNKHDFFLLCITGKITYLIFISWNRNVHKICIKIISNIWINII